MLDDPNETLGVEYKSWLDLSDNEVRARLARHIAALANYDGGSIVFGFNDAIEFAGQNQLPLPPCDRDPISSIVKKYLEPTFQCDVRNVVSSAGTLINAMLYIAFLLKERRLEAAVPSPRKRGEGGVLRAQSNPWATYHQSRRRRR